MDIIKFCQCFDEIWRSTLLSKEIYWEREQKPEDGPGMSSSLSAQNPSKEKRDGYWPHELYN